MQKCMPRKKQKAGKPNEQRAFQGPCFNKARDCNLYLICHKDYIYDESIIMKINGLAHSTAMEARQSRKCPMGVNH